MNHGIVAIALAVFVVTTLSACSSPDPTPVDEEQLYLNRVDKLFMSAGDTGSSRLTMTLGTLFPRFAPRDVQYSVIVNELREAKVDERIASDVETFDAI